MKGIYQFELTNYCNARCSFCPYQFMTRNKMHTTMETAKKVLELIKGKQKYIALHHFGEPLLHPQFEEIVRLFTDAGIRTEISSNGGLLNEKNIDKILRSGLSRIRISVNYFKPYEGINMLIEKAKNSPLDIKIHEVGANKEQDNFAGQVELESKMPKVPVSECFFIKQQYGVVASNGDVYVCCNDYNGVKVLGNVHNIKDLKEIETGPFELCSNCNGLQTAEGGEWQ